MPHTLRAGDDRGRRDATVIGHGARHLPTRAVLGLVGLLVGAPVLGLVTGVAAQPPLRAGAKEVGLVGGYSISHETHRGTDTLYGLDLIARFGYVLTDERGEGWLRGNFELMAEPTLIHFTDGESATIGGAAVMGRWLFVASPRIRPYLEAGAGVLGGESRFRQTNCDVNFLLQAGVGAMFFVSDSTALTVGYRVQHLSNAEQCSQDLGLNSSLVVLGLSYFFP